MLLFALGVIAGGILSFIVGMFLLLIQPWGSKDIDTEEQLHYAARQADKLFRRAQVRMDDAAIDYPTGRHHASQRRDAR